MKLFAAKNIRSRRVTSTGSDEKAIVNMNGAESALFVNALGKTQLFLSSALSATDFVFSFISAGMLKRWKKMIPNYGEEMMPNSAGEESHLVGPELIAYLQ